MRPRGRVFGIVFLLLGASLLLGSSLAYSRRLRGEAKAAQEHPNEWHLVFYEPSVFEDGAAWAVVAAEAMKFMRRRQAQ